MAVADDNLVLKDSEDYLDAIVAAGALSYRKIFDTTGASVHLSEDDLMALGARIRAYIPMGRIGRLTRSDVAEAAAAALAGGEAGGA